MFEYLLRLITLSLASYLFVATVVGAIVRILSTHLIGVASRLRAASAARLLFAVRMLPAAAACVAVLALCVPSYLWLEPEGEVEEIGVACAIAAVAGLALWIRGFLRAGIATAQLSEYIADCEMLGAEQEIAGQQVLVIEGKATTSAAGLMRPKLIFSRNVLDALSSEQLELAILHERAHSHSRDNLKRLAMLAAPDMVPLNAIESAWKKFSEWSADDRAVESDRTRALALAEALVRVARIHPQTAPSLATQLTGEDFSARVERLLGDGEIVKAPRWKAPAFAAAMMCAVLMRHGTLDFVHRALEKLIR
jgi:beta-lactamase regulating signal transducer with metallopeptidase domain